MSGLEAQRRRELVAALADLAEGCDTPAQVAAKLVQAGCKGERENCYDCPVAKWLIAKLPGPHLDVAVEAYAATARWESAETASDPFGLPEYDVDVTADMPPVLTAFILGFDEGEFPSAGLDTVAV